MNGPWQRAAHSVRHASIAALVLSAALAAHAQVAPPRIPTREELATNNKLFLETASKQLKWEEATEPLKIVGPLYFVGTRGLSSWLFATPEGTSSSTRACRVPVR